MVLNGGRTGWGSRTRNHLSYAFQNSIPIAFDQFIKQPQHGLDHSGMRRNLPRLAEGFNGVIHRRGDIMPLGYPPSADRDLVGREGFAIIRLGWHRRVAPTRQNQSTQRQPLRIQRGVIIGRLGKDFIRLRNGLGKSLLRGFPFPLPQSDDSVQGRKIR